MGTVLPNFPASPISEVQPFTYRDNESYLKQLSRLRDYVRDNLQRLNNQEIVDIAALRDNLNTLSDTLGADISTFETTINSEVANAVATANSAKTEADAAVASQDSATAQNINVGPLTDAALNTFLIAPTSPVAKKDAHQIYLADHVSGAGDLTSAIQTYVNTLPANTHLILEGAWRIDGNVTFAQNGITLTLADGCLIDRTQSPNVVAWAPQYGYAAGTQVRVSGYTLQATVGGNSGTATPTVPTTLNGTVTDGTITWSRVVSPEAASCLIFTGSHALVNGRGSILSKPVWDGLNTAWHDAVVKFTGDSSRCTGITLNNVPKYGVAFIDCNGACRADNITIHGNYPSSQWTEIETGNFGINYDPGTTDARIIIADNTIDSCVQAICVGNFGVGSSSGSIIAQNVIMRCWNHGIYNAGGLTDIICSLNTFRDCSRPIVMIDSGHIVTFNIMTASNTGSTLYWTGIQMRNPIDCIVFGNEIQGDVPVSSAGIDLMHVSGGTVCSGNQVRGNRIKLTAANLGNGIRCGTTASTVNARNSITDNVMEAPGTVSYGVIYISASATPTDASGNTISRNKVTIIGNSSGVYATNLIRPKISHNDIILNYDATAATVIAGIELVGATVGATLRDNTIVVPSTWGSMITFRAIWEQASTVLSSNISDNQISLDPTKLTASADYVLNTGGAILNAVTVGVPAYYGGPGSLIRRSDGGAGSTLYIKESAANLTTWRAI